MSLTPEQRVLRAKIAAHTRWGREADRRAATEPGRRGFAARFEREVDPEGMLPQAERLRRAESLMKAHMSALALKSSKSRKAKAAHG